MKKAIHILLIVLLTVSINSCRKNDKVGFELEKNCTGSYFKIDGKYYKICNDDMVAANKDGELINASYILLRDCPTNVPSICLMYFEFQGWLQIVKIK